MTSIGSGVKKKTKQSRNKERANMSFFIVVMFFAVFGIIVFTEIFLIDERGHGAGVVVRHGSLGGGFRHRSSNDRPDYEDVIQNDDYLALRNSLGGFDEALGAMLKESRGESHSNGKGIVQQGLGIDDNPRIPPGQPIANTLEAQLPPYPKYLIPKDGDWQIVNGTRYKFFVFSAYHDRRRGQQLIRVIGATKTRGPERVWCRFWYKKPENYTGSPTEWFSITVMAKVKAIRENWNLKYSASFILCPLRSNLSAPETVSVVSRIRSPPSNHLLVRNTNKDKDMLNFTKIPDGIAVCAKPFHFSYNKIMQILEFLELNQILGVKHFIFYNHTLGDEAGCILQDYIARGVVTLLPWRLDMASQKEIRTEGQFVAFNDCLYRSMYRFSHVLFVDVDEFVIPRYNDTLQQLMKWLSTKLNTRNAGSFSFQNAFFYIQWADDPSIMKTTNNIEANLLTLRKTRRKSKLHPHKQRSKFICRPEFILEVGNHFIWEFIPGHGTLNVPADSAILHHYRVCEYGGDDCIKTASIVDQTAYRYRVRLINRVGTIFDNLKNSCKLYNALLAPNKALTTNKSNKKSNKIFNDAKDFSFFNFNSRVKS